MSSTPRAVFLALVSILSAGALRLPSQTHFARDDQLGFVTTTSTTTWGTTTTTTCVDKGPAGMCEFGEMVGKCDTDATFEEQCKATCGSCSTTTTTRYHYVPGSPICIFNTKHTNPNCSKLTHGGNTSYHPDSCGRRSTENCTTYGNMSQVPAENDCCTLPCVFNYNNLGGCTYDIYGSDSTEKFNGSPAACDLQSLSTCSTHPGGTGDCCAIPCIFNEYHSNASLNCNAKKDDYFDEALKDANGDPVACSKRQPDKCSSGPGDCCTGGVPQNTATTTTTTTTTTADDSGGHGDPHMTNAYGEKFDIVREGLADLLIIRNGHDVLLKIQAMIKRTLPLCNGKFACNFGLFMTEITLSGRWVKKEFRFGTEKAQNKEEPSVLIDGTEVWPLSAENSIFSELNMKVSNFSAFDQGLRFDFMKATLDVRRVIENYAACKKDGKRKVKFFNMYFQGTKKLMSEGMTVGGILGKDPRHDWEKCDISDEFDMVNNWEKGTKFGFAKVE